MHDAYVTSYKILKLFSAVSDEIRSYSIIGLNELNTIIYLLLCEATLLSKEMIRSPKFLTLSRNTKQTELFESRLTLTQD